MQPFVYVVMVGLLWGMEPPSAPVEEFLVIIESVESITGIQRAVVAGTVHGVCAGLPGGTSGDYCTQLACPGPGTFRYTVEARPYQTRSNTITLRIKDRTCTQVEGMVLASVPSPVPTAVHCQPSVPLPPPAPVAVTVPQQQTTTVPIPQPQETAPVIPPNPQVVAKVPLEPGAPTRAPILARAPKVPTTDVPPPLQASVPTGPPETVLVAQPPVTSPGRTCP
jgi:hypothetical protein